MVQESHACKSIDGLQAALISIDAEIASVCVEFAALVWKKGVAHQHTHLVAPHPTHQIANPSPKHQTVDSPSPPAKVSPNNWMAVAARAKPHPPKLDVQLKSTTSEFPRPKAHYPEAPGKVDSRTLSVKKLRVQLKASSRVRSMRNMSKAEYKRRFKCKTSKSTQKPKPKTKKKKNTKKETYVRVRTAKDILQYLKDTHFVETNDSKTNDVRYERYFCACGACPIFEPAVNCGKKLRQFTDVGFSVTRVKGHYYQNKRTDIDRLTETAHYVHGEAS